MLNTVFSQLQTLSHPFCIVIVLFAWTTAGWEELNTCPDAQNGLSLWQDSHWLKKWEAHSHDRNFQRVDWLEKSTQKTRWTPELSKCILTFLLNSARLAKFFHKVTNSLVSYESFCWLLINSRFLKKPVSGHVSSRHASSTFVSDHRHLLCENKYGTSSHWIEILAEQKQADSRLEEGEKEACSG